MKRISLILCILVMLLTACDSEAVSPTATQTADQALISAATVAPSPVPLPSYTASPSPALQPSKTRTITLTATDTPTPSPSITPMSEGPVMAHPLALDTYNAAMQFRQLVRYGQGTLYDIDWSQDGKYLAVSTGLGVYLYDTVTFEQVRFINVNDGATHIDFCPDGNTLAVAQNTHISVWDINSGQKVIDMAGEIEGGIWKLVCGQGGYIAAVGQLSWGAGDAEPQLNVWWAPTGRLLYSDERNFIWTYAVDISPSGNIIAYSDDGDIKLRDIQSNEIIQEVVGAFDAVFSTDGTKIFTSSGDMKPLGNWMINLSSGKIQQILTGEKCQYLSLNGNGAVCFG
jgi:WD40 repeat protein